jgi:hypothetical protein
MAELTHLTDAVQVVYIYGSLDGDEELYGWLERWKDNAGSWDLRNGEGGVGYETAIVGMVEGLRWPDRALHIVYDTERNDI